MFSITPLGYVLVALVFFSRWCAIRIISKRWKQRLNYITVGYIWLVILCINSLTLGGILLVHDNLSNFIQGERIEAIIVDFTLEERGSILDDDDGGPTYRPIIRFTAPNGEVITRESNSGSGEEPVIGDPYAIYYDSERDSLSYFSVATIGATIATAVFTLTFCLLSFGIVRYALGYGMAGFTSFFGNYLMLFVLPLALIVFDALLIYGTFFNGPYPLWVYPILAIFIIAITGLILGYMKKMITRKSPRNRGDTPKPSKFFRER